MKPSTAILGALWGWSALTALAGPLSLDRGVVGSGGGTSSSARFGVLGTVGQPVASTEVSHQGTWSERAGFWAQTLRWLNVPPVAVADAAERRAGQGTHLLVTELLANDSDGDWDALQVLSVAATSTAGGAVFREGPWVIYEPPAGGGPASDSFTYQVTDGQGGVTVGAVLIQVALPPANGASPLAVRNLVGPPEQVEVRFQGIAGRTYRVQTAATVDGPWSDLGSRTAGGTGVILFLESPQALPRFYRIIEP